MTDTSGRPPEGPEPGSDLTTGSTPEERLPVPRPSTEVAPVERFTSPPSIRSFELSPERAAQVVRQSSNARWVGFLATVVVILFVAIYWFYELGLPAGLSEPRLQSELNAQQVTSVERGYLVYEANCARCHGEQGEGGEGPTLNRQDKLFAHLNEDYIRNILRVGGRYACGTPNSAMPIWDDQANPPGPLNYRQIDELVSFLMATNEQVYIVRDEHLLDPKVDPVSGEVLTFTGWRDPNYAPEPGATPFPDCWTDEFTAGASASPGASASVDPAVDVVDVVAVGSAFTTPTITVRADAPFTLSFDNQDASIPHDVQIKGEDGSVVFKTATFPGVAKQDFSAPAFGAGSYDFFCSVHPQTMTGTLTAE